MPTATATVISEALSDDATSILSLKAPKSAVAESSTAATLRSLYPRAAKAFLQRDFALTHSLITSAFALVGPPASATEDDLDLLRRKWDILRITLEITVYSSPPPSADSNAHPAALRANQTMSPPALLNALYTRSIELFTPTAQSANAAYLPYQILYTLGSAGVKLGCSEISRNLIEDWLARRVPDGSEQGRKGYVKVVELYCVHVLPRLEDWQSAEDFLQYERELDSELRTNMATAVRESRRHTLETRSLLEASRVSKTASASSSTSSSRAVSPAPSTSSESSTSTHTATPRTPHPEQKKTAKGKGRAGTGTLNGLTHFTPSTPPSPSGDSAATARTVTPDGPSRRRANGVPDASRGRGAAATLGSQPRSGAISPTPQPSRSSTLSPPAIRPPTTLAVIRTYLQNVLGNASRTKLAALFLLFVVFPFVSFVLRMRRRRMLAGGTSTASQVRRRLRGIDRGTGGTAGVVASLWEEIVRAIGDTIRMGGGGLA